MNQMEETRTLPPLVRGKVTDNCDFVVKVQWWGEVFPAYLRPKKLHLAKITHKTYGNFKTYCHSTSYEIKTTLDLFKSYLNTCEMLELPVLEAVDMCVIGSAFLRDLIGMLNSNNEPITIPLINCLGDIIGEITIHISFSEKLLSTSGKCESTQNMENKSPFKTNIYITNRHKSLENANIYKFLSNQNTTFTSSNSSEITPKVFGMAHTSSNKQLSGELNVSENKENTSACEENDGDPVQITRKISKLDEKLLNQSDNVSNKSSVLCKKFPCKCLPEVKRKSDSSKIIYSGLGLFKKKSKSCNLNLVKNASKNLANTSTNKKLRSDKVDTDNQKSKSSQKVATKDFENNTLKNHTFRKQSSEKFVENQTSRKSCKDSSLSYSLKSGQNADDSCQCIKEIFTEESSNKKVLDYLFGTEMSRADEEKALTEFKNMSPSHNLVSSIGQLYSVSECNFQNCKPVSISCRDKEAEPPKPVKVYPLNFDLSNPIEKNYFEKFFVKSNSASDLKIAELLNPPNSEILLEKCESDSKHKRIENVVQKKDEFPYEGVMVDGKLPKNFKKSDFTDSSNCNQCEYIKTLEELDVIIESLKHFEKKIFGDEKRANRIFAFKQSSVDEMKQNVVD